MRHNKNWRCDDFLPDVGASRQMLAKTVANFCCRLLASRVLSCDTKGQTLLPHGVGGVGPVVSRGSTFLMMVQLGPLSQCLVNDLDSWEDQNHVWAPLWSKTQGSSAGSPPEAGMHAWEGIVGAGTCTWLVL